MDQRPANDFVLEVNFDATDVSFLRKAGLEDAQEGVVLLDSDEASLMQGALVRTDQKIFNRHGAITADGQLFVSLLNKLHDDPACRWLRASAAGGDARAAFDLACRKMAGPAGLLYPEEAACLLMQAHLGGLNEATRELADMRGDLRLLVGFSEAERQAVLESAALDGDPSAAMALDTRLLPRERLIAVLRAVAEGSAECAEWLDQLESEP